VDFGLGPDAFVFIPFGHFWDHDYRTFLAPSWRLPALFRGSVLANGYRFVGGRFVVEGIGRERIGVLTHHEVAVGRMEFHDDRISHARDLEHAHAMDVLHGHGADGRGDDRRDFDHHRRAPKVTVTREGASLCQKGCYPSALVFC
jgi:hypothetical protein